VLLSDISFPTFGLAGSGGASQAPLAVSQSLYGKSPNKPFLFIFRLSLLFQKEEKIFYWQKEGVGIGNVASGAFANGTLLVGERKMLKEMKEQGYRILLYKRYTHDILAIFEHQDGLQKRKGAEMMEKLINNLDSTGGSIKVAPAKGITSMRKREKETQEESVEYLDFEIVLTGQSEMRLETGIYRKEAAADMYIQANPAHPWALKMGVVKGEVIRYLTLCSAQQRNALKKPGQDLGLHC